MKPERSIGLGFRAITLGAQANSLHRGSYLKGAHYATSAIMPLTSVNDHLRTAKGMNGCYCWLGLRIALAKTSKR